MNKFKKNNERRKLCNEFLTRNIIGVKLIDMDVRAWKDLVHREFRGKIKVYPYGNKVEIALINLELYKEYLEEKIKNESTSSIVE